MYTIRRGYKSKPLRRIYIPKKNGKKRRIPTMLDRAMQALHKLALAPVAETTADKNSYGFRETTDGIYYFLSNQGISDHSKRCFLQRFFILVDSYLDAISFFKNKLFSENKISIKIKQLLENEIKDIREEWENNYEIIRNKISAHHQDIDEVKLLEWWNEIDYTTITFFYDGMRKIRSILTKDANILTLIPTDYVQIDFSDTCLRAQHDSNFYFAYDRLGISKKNTVSLIGINEFQRKCMLILSIVDFIFIDCAITVKTQNYDTNYKKIIFDSAWLLISCDTTSLIENLYEDSLYGNSLLYLSPPNWKGTSILEKSNSGRDVAFEEELRILRNKFAAHIDVREQLQPLLVLFENFDLKKMHKYCMHHMQAFQRACLSDIRTEVFAFRDQKLSDDIKDISYSGHTTIDS